MGFRKENDLDFVDPKTSLSPDEREKAPRRAFKLEDLQTMDPSSRETVSIDLSAGIFGEPAIINTGEFELEEIADVRGQTLVRTQQFGRSQTLIGEAFPKALRQRGSFLVIGGGILLGFLVALTVLMNRNSAGPLDQPLAAVQQPMDVVSPEAALSSEMFAVPQNEIQKQISVQESVVVPESGIVEYASSQPVQVAPRQFLFASGTQRTFGASLETPQFSAPNASRSGATTGRNLQKSGRDGRYVNDRDGKQWQGDWKLNTPGENIARAESYSEYIGSAGSSSLNSLKVVQQPKAGLLKGAAGASIAPKLSK